MVSREEYLSEHPARGNSMGEKGDGHALLQNLFIVLFAQLCSLILVSFIEGTGLQFVERFYFGLDYHDFYVGAIDWLHHVDPYLRGRIFTAPSSILVGLALAWLPFKLAAVVFALINLTLTYAAVWALKSQFDLNRSDQLCLLGIAAVFYPYLFLIQRGNLDCLVFALLIFGFKSNHWLMRSLLLGLSVAVKSYTGLLLLLLIRKRRNLKVVIGSGLVFIAMQLPFMSLLRSFISATNYRSGIFRFDENISPASIAWAVAAGKGQWKLVFVLIWMSTLLYRLIRHWKEDVSHTWPIYVPWMISLPILVYPYSGIHLLALAALLARECQNRLPTIFETLILVGISLVGFQAVAWTASLHVNSNLLHGMGAIGISLTLFAACFLPSYQSDTPHPSTN